MPIDWKHAVNLESVCSSEDLSYSVEGLASRIPVILLVSLHCRYQPCDTYISRNHLQNARRQVLGGTAQGRGNYGVLRVPRNAAPQVWLWLYICVQSTLSHSGPRWNDAIFHTSGHAQTGSMLQQIQNISVYSFKDPNWCSITGHIDCLCQTVDIGNIWAGWNLFSALSNIPCSRQQLNMLQTLTVVE